MKSKITFLIVFLIALSSLAQSSINYKAVIKDGSGNIVANDLIQVQFSILDGSTSLYTETHAPTTDDNGIIILNIGEGTPITGVFANIDWSTMNHFLNVMVNTGAGLQDMGTTAFSTVPYAKVATDVENTIWNKDTSGDITFNGGYVGIGTNNPQNTLSVLHEIGIANTVRIESQDHPTGKDLIELVVPTGSTAGSQFIEMQNGSSIVAAINSDGSAQFKSVQFEDFTTQTTAAVGPLAYGFVSADASINSGSGNFSAVWNASLSRYEITISGVSYFYRNFATNITISTSTIHRSRVSSNSGNLIVYLYNSSGTPSQGEFQFTTFQ